MPEQPVLFRPFRHLCGEVNIRDAMSDEEFWEHVYSREAWTEEDPWDDGPGDPLAIENGVTNPCPECGQIGACAYDAEGRPMIHAVEVNDAG